MQHDDDGRGPTAPPSEALLDELLAEVRPAGPAELGARVRARLEQGPVRRSGWRRARVALGVSLAAAAVLLAVRERRSVERAPTAATARGALLVETIAEPVTLDGARGRSGEPTRVGAVAKVGPGGTLRLALPPRTRLALEEGEATVEAKGLRLRSGRVRIEGAGAEVRSAEVRVAPLDAELIAEMTRNERRTRPGALAPEEGAAMRPDARRKLAVGGALGAAIVTVAVLRGSARVEAADGAAVAVLSAGDRALVGSGGPPVVLRAPAARGRAEAGAAAELDGARAARAAARLRATPPPGAPDRAAAPSAGAAGGGGFGDEPPGPGTLDKEAIRAGIRAVIPEIRKCYEAGLERDPSLAGTVRVQFTIEAREGEGRVSAAEIEVPEGEPAEAARRDLASPLTEQCLLGAMAEARFPVPQGGGRVTVRYPLVFNQEGPPPPSIPPSPKAPPKNP